jgi:hypothetical protein
MGINDNRQGKQVFPHIKSGMATVNIIDAIQCTDKTAYGV